VRPRTRRSQTARPKRRHRVAQGAGALGTTALFATALVLIVLTASPSLARRTTSGEIDPIAVELNSARQALILGDAEAAIRLYESVLEKNPNNTVAFWGLMKSLEAAGHDRERLVPLLEDLLEREPWNIKGMYELGEAYARLGEFDPAHELWMRALGENPEDPDRYAEVGALEIRHRMYEHAVSVYIEGRRVFDRPSLFAQELVQAYTLLGKFDNALDECVLLVEEHPSLVQWATNRVELLLEEGATRRQVERRVEDVAESNGSTPSALAFAGSVFLVLEKPERALGAFLRADEITGDGGNELLAFATILKDEGDLAEAREAYAMVAERHPASAGAAVASIAAARILSDLGQPREAVSELKATADAFMEFREGAEALLTAARIELEELRDPTAALRSVDELSIGPRMRARQINQEGALVAIDAYLTLGRLDDAYARAEALIEGKARGATLHEAMFQLGYVSLLRHETGQALGELRTMVEENPAWTLVNDALRLMLVIADGEETGLLAPVILFADAHAARLRYDVGEALSLLEELVEAHLGTPAAAEGYMLMGRMAEDEGDIDGALTVYAHVIASIDAIRVSAEARMRRGDILAENKRWPEKAIVEYTGILDELPPNFLSGEARRKIDRLRNRKELEG